MWRHLLLRSCDETQLQNRASARKNKHRGCTPRQTESDDENASAGSWAHVHRRRHDPRAPSSTPPHGSWLSRQACRDRSRRIAVTLSGVGMHDHGQVRAPASGRICERPRSARVGSGGHRVRRAPAWRYHRAGHRRQHGHFSGHDCQSQGLPMPFNDPREHQQR